jgi:hypothetical protein
LPCTCADLVNPNITCQCSRKNFDSFMHASLTVFQACDLRLGPARSSPLFYSDTHARGLEHGAV